MLLTGFEVRTRECIGAVDALCFRTGRQNADMHSGGDVVVEGFSKFPIYG